MAGEKWLVWLYNNPVGEATLWSLAKRKVVSSVDGKSMDRPSSIKKIQPLVVIRLAPSITTVSIFPISGSASPITRIEGDYYSVNPLALHKMAEIFCLNKREFTILSNPLFGDVVMIEVGATMVGSIVQTYKGNFVKKGDEKGYFKFGGVQKGTSKVVPLSL